MFPSVRTEHIESYIEDVLDTSKPATSVSATGSEIFRSAARENAKPIVYKRDRLGDVETHLAMSSGVGAGTTVTPVATTASVQGISSQAAG
jgi:hypothetical protein